MLYFPVPPKPISTRSTVLTANPAPKPVVSFAGLFRGLFGTSVPSTTVQRTVSSAQSLTPRTAYNLASNIGTGISVIKSFGSLGL